MNTYKAIIVDDEKIARDTLHSFLNKYCPEIEILDMAIDVKEGINKIKQCNPDLVFLDVEMPYGNAFDLLEACKDNHFQTIFITAFSEYSLRALNLSAAYYILKPINIEELIIAVQKVKELIDTKHYINLNKIVLENYQEKSFDKKRVVLPTMEGFELVKMKEIIYLQANGNFTNVYLQNGTKQMVCRMLKHFEDNLSENFMRVHRSSIVNLNYIKSYQKGNGGTLLLENKLEVEISQSYKDLLLKRLGAKN